MELRSRGRILVIDDEPVLGRALARILKSEHDVTVVQDGRTALDLVSHMPPFDVIFCDLMMPGFSGVDFYNQMSEMKPNDTSRIVFITGGAFLPQARAFLASIPNPCVEKPFSAPEILQLIRVRLQEQP